MEAATTQTAPTPAAAAAVNPDSMLSYEEIAPISVEDFLNFPNEDAEELIMFSENTIENETQSIMADSSSSVNLLDCKSSIGDFGSSSLLSELCDPYDDPSELEWVSRFSNEYDTFSTEDMEKLHFISGMSARPDEPRPDPIPIKSESEIHFAGIARNKNKRRPRATSGNWNPRLSLESKLDPNRIKKPKTARKYGPEYLTADGRKCQHCQTDKTPQWRTGPEGPKTLCNACGVRYKTGRLMPEYRPASSPTFVQTKHSNSHRKVMELRRQNEMMLGAHQPNQRYFEQYRGMWLDPTVRIRGL